MNSVKSLFLLVVLLFFRNSGPGHGKQPAKHESPFYSANDFTSLEKIDAHVHIRTGDTAFVHQARVDHFKLLTIVVDESPGIGRQQKYAIEQMRLFPGLVDFATTFPVTHLNNPHWQERTIESLKESFIKGAIAVKIYKNIGMELKDNSGRFIMIDSPVFDPVMSYLEKNNIPVIGHLGEPKNCWLPMDQMTMESDKRYFSRHPEFYMYLHPDYPSYEDQINARDRLLEKHPGLRFIGAHLGSMEWSTEELARHLDKFPNMAVDMASRISNLQLQAMQHWQKVYNFFIKYQDRLIYGTDRIADGSKSDADVKKFVHAAWLNDWTFFCTNDLMSSSSFKGTFKGLQLPKEVIDKIYRENAEKWFPGISKNIIRR